MRARQRSSRPGQLFGLCRRKGRDDPRYSTVSERSSDHGAVGLSRPHSRFYGHAQHTRGKKKGRGLPRNSPYLAIIADLVVPFVEDDLVMPLAAVHDVLPAREPFVVERVDLVVSISPHQRVVAVVAIQGVIALAAVEAVLPVGTVRVVPVIVTAQHVSPGTAVESVVAEVTG